MKLKIFECLEANNESEYKNPETKDFWRLKISWY